MVRKSCQEIINVIQRRVERFRNGRGMVLVLLEGARATIYYFNGVPRCSWSYVNGQFETDRIGQSCLEDGPDVFAIEVNQEGQLVPSIKRAFAHHDVNVRPLWQLDQNAWDYDVMSSLHGNDVGVRISFD